MVTTVSKKKRYKSVRPNDPPIRKDGLCFVCRSERPRPDDPKGIYRTDLDPFCSTKCCKEYYEVNFDYRPATKL